MGDSTGGISRVRFRCRYVPKSFNSFRVYAFAMYQMCRVILMVFSAMPDNIPGIREWNSTIDSR